MRITHYLYNAFVIAEGDAKIAIFWKRKIALADDARFKRDVEKLGVECRILQSGESFDLQGVTV
ncbi:MAG: hypothetical protein K0U72_03145 [Gammaproteobacteria bacterium]|nr:hypothetical protein [Gammaproteobacteria bacterium]